VRLLHPAAEFTWAAVDPKALGRLKAMTEGSAESVTPEQVEEAGDVLSA
jgi:hypothetical protein